MKNRLLSIASIILILSFLLSACNLPERHVLMTPTTTSPVGALPQVSPTPAPLCDNLYFPTAVGDTWEYSGTNSFIDSYTRTDTITKSEAESFTQQTDLANITYSVPYNCSSSGLTSTNPIQQYAGALLSSPDSPVNVKLSSNQGVSLPANILPGDTWQQTADFEANSQKINVNGRFVFDYTAVGYENVSVTAGTYNAMRVDATIRIEVTGLHVLAGTYTTTTWYAPDIGMIKSEGTSHITGITFSDSMQLSRFTPAP